MAIDVVLSVVHCRLWEQAVHVKRKEERRHLTDERRANLEPKPTRECRRQDKRTQEGRAD